METTQPCVRLTPAEQLAAELAIISEEMAAVVLLSRAVVERYDGLTDDGRGGRVETWTADAALALRFPDGVPVRIEQGRPGQALSIGGRMIDSTDDYRIDYPNDVHLGVRDRLTIDGNTYELQAVDEISTAGALNTAWAIVAEY